MTTTKTRSATEIATENALEVIKSGRVAYCRFDPRFGGRVLVYGRDDESPTGVLLIAAFDEKTWDEAMKSSGSHSGNISPLSPTEGR